MPRCLSRGRAELQARRRQWGPRAKQSPHATPARRARSGRALPAPPATKPAPVGSGPAAHQTSVGSDRPSSPECRCPPHPRCGGSGWSPWCATGWGGTRVAEEASSRGHGPDQATRTLTHGLGSLGLRAPTPGSARGPTPRRPSAPRARGTSGNGVPLLPRVLGCNTGSPPGNYISQHASVPGPL